MPEAAPAPQTGETKAPAPAPKAGKKAAPAASDAAENTEKKPRAPRKDYGYGVGSVIKVDKEKEQKFTGKRADYYKLLLECDGKTVNDFEGGAPEGDPPRGWLRFFCQEGYASLTRVTPEPVKEEAKK